VLRLSIYPAGTNPPPEPEYWPELRTFTEGRVSTCILFTLVASRRITIPRRRERPPIPGMRVQDGQPLPTNFTRPASSPSCSPISASFRPSIRVTDSAGAHFDSYAISPYGFTALDHIALSLAQGHDRRAIFVLALALFRDRPYSYAFTRTRRYRLA